MAVEVLAGVFVVSCVLPFGSAGWGAQETHHSSLTGPVFHGVKPARETDDIQLRGVFGSVVPMAVKSPKDLEITAGLAELADSAGNVEDAATAVQIILAGSLNSSAQEALERLSRGNKRYVEFREKHPHADREWRAGLAEEQQPFAVILSCADSRVVPELIFDQGIGDLFVLRVAGNVACDSSTASIEYAVVHLGVSLVVVLGH